MGFGTHEDQSSRIPGRAERVVMENSQPFYLDNEEDNHQKAVELGLSVYKNLPNYLMKK